MKKLYEASCDSHRRSATWVYLSSNFLPLHKPLRPSALISLSILGTSLRTEGKDFSLLLQDGKSGRKIRFDLRWHSGPVGDHDQL